MVLNKVVCNMLTHLHLSAHHPGQRAALDDPGRAARGESYDFCVFPDRQGEQAQQAHQRLSLPGRLGINSFKIPLFYSSLILEYWVDFDKGTLLCSFDRLTQVVAA